jgi:hypothetical protein
VVGDRSRHVQALHEHAVAGSAGHGGLHTRPGGRLVVLAGIARTCRAFAAR